ncbi:MAG: universal stress protein [Gammaproteobacteria bacterium]|jgi:nucleotide-binding universal stress UspA family protein
MQNRILIPVDGTESVEEILLYVTAITPRSDTHVTLLHVLPPSRQASSGHSHADEIHDALSQDGWKVSRELRMGDPVDEIVKLALLQPATMLMMSTHGRSGLERIREGSVTEQVVKLSPCPVFILHTMRPDTSESRGDALFRRILVPLDGTPTSAAILKCVERFAKFHDSDVIIFHDELEGSGSPEKKSVIREAIEAQSIALANTGLSVSLELSTYRHPIREILNRIDELNINLVAMATHGETGERRALDESVTAEVIRHANCPLLVWSADPTCHPADER